MPNWGFLSSLLDKVMSHSTYIGQIWMPVLLLFRIMVLCGPVKRIWSDDKSGFRCQTVINYVSPLCHDLLFPISYINYWTLQLILVSTPTLLYLGHVMLVTHKENKLREQHANPQLKKGHVKIKGNLLCSYLIHLLAKIIIEVVSVWGEVKWLHGFSMKAEITCPRAPGTFSTNIDCFMTHAIAKTYVIRYMLFIACFSVLLNLIEMVYILCKQKCCFRSCKKRNRSRVVVEDLDSVQIHSLPMEDPDSMQTQRSLPSYNSHMLENLQNQQLEDNVDTVEDGQAGSLSGSLDRDQGGETTTALVQRQSKHSYLFP